jgi:hypothetical protein
MDKLKYMKIIGSKLIENGFSGSVRSALSRVIIVFAVIFIIVQLFGVSNILSRHMDNAGIVSSYSMDAGNGLSVAMNTEFFNDNGWRPYGPTYYRLTYFLSTFNDQLIGPFLHAPDRDKKEAILHFYLMLMSVVSIFGISYLLANILVKSLWLKLISSTFLTSIFLSNDLWVTLIWWLHPDLLLTFFAGLYSFYAIKYFDDVSQENRSIIILGIIGGIGLSVKFIFGVFLLPTILFLVYPINIQSIKKLFQFGLVIVVSFFIVGFPQNFQIVEIFNFLQQQSEYRIPATSESISNWVDIIVTQFRPVIIGLTGLVFLFLFEKTEYNIKFSRIGLLLLFILIPWLVLFSLNFKLSTDYYILPFLSFSFIALAFLLRSLANRFSEMQYMSYLKPAWKGVAPILLIGYMVAKVDLVPHTLVNNGIHWLDGRDNIHEIYQFGYTSLDEGKFILRDPYTAFPNIGNYAYTSQDTVNRFLKQGKADYLIISSKWYDRFLKEAPNPYDLTGVGEKEWYNMHSFYTTLLSSESIVNIYNKRYEKILTRDHIQIWSLVE